ncbi:uncharacterized protein C8Q71DRAFT_593936 [Rhodofomes roseus]|uniref:Uncharacterized protein n=1 Tax=Rhodofomes roseus TaxID=34475 RepID=A0ABQ8KHF1_9APHY|nr:uncharacterized protein C8Q71DRAFT_593936 [Rhodofomes roseus]KAH9837272.1 hypothetical protein C8Q71DRAFT_593936 [Rhodofomes roseus]
MPANLFLAKVPSKCQGYEGGDVPFDVTGAAIAVYRRANAHWSMNMVVGTSGWTGQGPSAPYLFSLTICAVLVLCSSLWRSARTQTVKHLTERHVNKTQLTPKTSTTNTLLAKRGYIASPLALLSGCHTCPDHRVILLRQWAILSFKLKRVGQTTIR